MTIQETRKHLIRRFYDEAWGRGDFAIIDELFAADYASVLPGTGLGPEAARADVSAVRATFSDLKIAIDDLVADGDTVIVRGLVTGTDTGGFMGRPPTGRTVTYWAVRSYYFTGDRISSCWFGGDSLGLMIQLGMIPSPWPAAEAADASET